MKFETEAPPTKRAIFALTDETLPLAHSKDTSKRFAYIISDYSSFTLRRYQMVSEKALADAIPGEYFEENSDGLGLEMAFPRAQDLLCVKTIGDHTLSIYKIFICFWQCFADRPREEYEDLIEQVTQLAVRRYALPGKLAVERFITAMFAHNCSVRGHTKGLPITLNTPCRDFFYPEADWINSCIGIPIESAFGLEQFHLGQGLFPCAFRECIPDPNFRLKYPVDAEATDWFTLRVFIDMIYDIIRIKYGTTADLFV